MKKITALALTALIATSSIFAQSTMKTQTMPMPGNPNSPNSNEFRMRGPRGCWGRHKEDDKVVIGTVKTVNVKTNTIKVVNTDGKDVEFVVSPFTRICILPDAPTQEKPAPSTLSDIRSGAWVMISKFETDGKTLNAARICVRKNPAQVDYSQAK